MLGNKQTVRDLTPEQMRHYFFDRRYSAGNAVMVAGMGEESFVSEGNRSQEALRRYEELFDA